MPRQQVHCPHCGHTTFSWNVEARAFGELAVGDDEQLHIESETIGDVLTADIHIGVVCEQCGEMWDRNSLEAETEQDTLENTDP